MTDHLAISPHPMATAVGNELLAAGAAAAEAAVAIGALLSVVMPHFCGIGGDAVWLAADAEGTVTAINGIGQAFSFTENVAQIEMRGPRSILTTAAAIRTWETAIALQAPGCDIAPLLEPAIKAARDGFPVGASQEFWTQFRADEIGNWLGFETYAEARQGQKMIQPALAGTLSALSENGLDSFYQGDLAARILADLRNIGINARPEDLAATRAEHGAPMQVAYRDVLLHAPPPPTQGVTTLEIMGILDRLGPAPEMGSADDYHLMVEAVKAAFLDRGRIDDADDARAYAEKLLSPAHLDERAASVDRQSARAWPHVFETADTVYFAARDRKGRCISALQSTYYDWGSGCCLPQTGIIWHNRGASFRLTDGPNRLRPGRRPFHTLTPGIATRGGKPYLLYGTQGADGQPQTSCVILRHMIDHGLAPNEALHAPRFLLGRTFSDSRDSLKLEPMRGSNALQAMGHEVSPIPALSPLAGLAGAIRIEGNEVIGASDPRGAG
ncbi:gamma-glutamyltransferase [Neorhizobium sp. NCHU2750]|uniref:gamma-glutamyltransferase family protein n=1 Tax=Neorhizobium sp. NCHU2750 TaxID=1825976 RepID=UPI000E72FAF0|nr:gamma-glutamyltranspeptidase [Neorhizobium sp. NCHU2750]